MSLAGADGATHELRTQLTGKVTALHLMFTACTVTCPIQGALFAELQRSLSSAGPEMQLLSVSIDAADSAQKLSAWLKRYGAQPTRWTAGTASTVDADVLIGFVRGKADGADRHSAQTYVFDRRGRLVFRSESLPSADALVEVMRQVSRLPLQ
jgi:protein SCO1/2